MILKATPALPKVKLQSEVRTGPKATLPEACFCCCSMILGHGLSGEMWRTNSTWSYAAFLDSEACVLPKRLLPTPLLNKCVTRGERMPSTFSFEMSASFCLPTVDDIPKGLLEESCYPKMP